MPKLLHIALFLRLSEKYINHIVFKALIFFLSLYCEGLKPCAFSYGYELLPISIYINLMKNYKVAGLRHSTYAHSEVMASFSMLILLSCLSVHIQLLNGNNWIAMAIPYYVPLTIFLAIQGNILSFLSSLWLDC